MLRPDPGHEDRPLITTAAVGIGLLVTPLVLSSQRELSLLSFVAIFGLVAYSIAIAFRYAGVLMIAQGAVWGVGAYTGGLLHNEWGWSFWAVLPAAAVLSAVAAVVIGTVSLRSNGHYFLIVTFAINEFIVLAATQMDFTGGQGGLLVLDPPDALGPISFASPTNRYRLYLAFLVAGLGLFVFVGRTAFGRRLVAIRENEDLARSVGVSILRSKLAVLAVGGAMAGVAGVLYVYHQRAVQPDLFSALLFLQIVLMVIIGGSRTVLGPLVGAFLLLFLPDKLGLSPTAQQITYGVLLIGIILLAPEGVAGTIRRWVRARRSPSSGLRSETPAPQASPRQSPPAQATSTTGAP